MKDICIPYSPTSIHSRVLQNVSIRAQGRFDVKDAQCGRSNDEKRILS